MLVSGKDNGQCGTGTDTKGGVHGRIGKTSMLSDDGRSLRRGGLQVSVWR